MDSGKPRNLTLRNAESGAAIVVMVTPRAGKDEITGMQGDAIKIRLAAAPVDGGANEALVKFLAKCLDLRQNAIEIVAGHSSRKKLVSIVGLSPAEVTARLFP
jgi:uncharacterized protein